MTNLPSWLTIPTAGSASSKNTTGLNMSTLYSPNDLLPAEHLNYFLNGLTNNENVSETALANVISELVTILTAASIAPNSGLTNQVKAALDVLYTNASNLASGTVPTGQLGNAVIGPGASLSTDGTFAANSDSLVPSQKAVKTYVDAKAPIVLDARTTTGGVNRTETVNSLGIGQIALIDWVLYSTSTITISFALPAGGTYSAYVTSNGSIGGNTGLARVTDLSTVYTRDNTAGGSTIALQNPVSSGLSIHLSGFVRRIS